MGTNERQRVRNYFRNDGGLEHISAVNPTVTRFQKSGIHDVVDVVRAAALVVVSEISTEAMARVFDARGIAKKSPIVASYVLTILQRAPAAIAYNVHLFQRPTINFDPSYYLP